MRLLHELLHAGLAPGAERAAAEAAGETLHAGESDARDLDGLAIEHLHARVGQDAAHLGLLARLVVVIAEHGDDRNAHDRGQLLREDAAPLRAGRSR